MAQDFNFRSFLNKNFNIRSAQGICSVIVFILMLLNVIGGIVLAATSGNCKKSLFGSNMFMFVVDNLEGAALIMVIVFSLILDTFISAGFLVTMFSFSGLAFIIFVLDAELVAYGLMAVVSSISQGLLMYILKKFNEQIYENILGHQIKIRFDSLVESSELEIVLECCGLGGPKYYENRNMDIPNSCCPAGGKIDGGGLREASTCDINDAHKNGCDKEYLDVVACNNSLIVQHGVFLAFQVITAVVIFVREVIRRRDEEDED